MIESLTEFRIELNRDDRHSKRLRKITDPAAWSPRLNVTFRDGRALGLRAPTRYGRRANRHGSIDYARTVDLCPRPRGWLPRASCGTGPRHNLTPTRAADGRRSAHSGGARRVRPVQAPGRRRTCLLLRRAC